jgi:hypothetical protein
MSIYLRKTAEPGSIASDTHPSILAQGEVSDRLRRILTRYVRGEVTGRSFLVSGHRGSGKTTLIKKVVQEVADEFRSGPYRPLLVTLSGPMLLPDEQNDSEKDTQRVLTQLTLNLYRKLARHFSDRYEHLAFRALGGVDESFQFDLRKRQHAQKLSELTADFRLKLDGPLELAELRGFWDACHCLESGILFDDSNLLPITQGTREIVALYSCLRAYLTLAGDYSLKSGTTDAAARKAEISAKSPLEKGVLSALISAGSGSAVGAALLAGHYGTLFSAFSAVATALGAAVVLNFSASRSRESSSTLESSISIKRDLQSLSRELPELLHRCRAAGVIPVFLVDELDKVSNLQKRMQSLIFSTKLFVTEESLFFFVTDRSYYEYIQNLSRTSAYPREHTFFSERLFVSYQPENWRRYLNDLIIPGSTESTSQNQEREAIEMLNFALLCRSRMHAIDLRRAIGEVARVPSEAVREDVESVVPYASSDFAADPRYRLEILMQVAVEVTLVADPDFASRCSSEPPFTQVAYDALYFLARKWEIAAEDLFAHDESEFRNWLETRSPDASSEVAGVDVSYLFRKVGRILFWLQNPVALAGDPVASSLFPPKVMESLAATPPLVGRSDKEPDKFRWLFDTFGRSLNPVDVEQLRNDAQLRADIALIDSVALIVARATDQKITLLEIQKAGLLPSTPEVSALANCVERLRSLQAAPSPSPYPQMSSDAHDVPLFAGYLRTYSGAIARCILISWTLACGCSQTPENPDFLLGWNTFVRRAESKYSTIEQTTAFTESLSAAVFGKFFPSPAPALSVPSIEQYNHGQWGAAVQASIQRVRQTGLVGIVNKEAAERTALQGWLQVCASYLERKPFQYGQITGTTLDEVLAAALGSATGALRPDLSTVSIFEWSLLVSPSAADPYTGLMLTALVVLGFETVASKLLYQPTKQESALPPSLVQALRSRCSTLPSLPRPKAFLLRLSEKSMALTWLPDPSCACLILPQEERNYLSAILDLFETLDFIFIEAGPPTEPLFLGAIEPQAADRAHLSSTYSPRVTRVAVLTSQMTPLAGVNIPVITAPLGVEDIIKRLRASPPPSSPQAPRPKGPSSNAA